MDLLKSFKKILEILTDYPEIKEIISLEKAGQLIDGLAELPEEIIITLTEKPLAGKLDQVIESVKNRWQSWYKALEKIDFAFFEIDLEDDKDIIFWGSIILNSTNLNDDPDVVIYLRLSVNNKASLETDETSEKITDDFSGTWEEVYNKAVEIKNNFIPEAPNE
jgi:hypothetical protein